MEGNLLGRLNLEQHSHNSAPHSQYCCVRIRSLTRKQSTNTLFCVVSVVVLLITHGVCWLQLFCNQAVIWEVDVF